MLHPELKYCPISELMSVVDYVSISDTDYGIKVLFSFPKILLWDGDYFGYVDRMRVHDVIVADSRPRANELINQRITEIFTWEHRKAYDGIYPIMLNPGSEGH